MTARSTWVANILLLVLALLVCCLCVEVAYRWLDPFEYIPMSEILTTENEKLTQYDSLLGWRGVPGGEALLITQNSRVRIAHNGLGFRDEEPGAGPNEPRVIFLGDSFTWGFEVDYDEMFVTRFRRLAQGVQVHNLSHRGYGTDQSLHVLRQFDALDSLGTVFLMFCENDMSDNCTEAPYGKPKPVYRVVQDSLVLTGVPTRNDEMRTIPLEGTGESAAKSLFKRVAFSSHFLHDMYFRLWLMLRSGADEKPAVDSTGRSECLNLTARLLEALHREVSARGGDLVVVFIPSKSEIEAQGAVEPYQKSIQSIGSKLSINTLDLAPALQGEWLRTYFRHGMHWNARGHRVAADALFDYWRSRGTPANQARR